MVAEAVERKLAAILSADVAGYSRLMAEDETETVSRLTAYRTQITHLVEEHRGRVVDFTGDNFLAEFPTATGAVEAAAEIQRVLKARNAALPEGRAMEFRMGIHLGEVRVEGERIYGDGVNIAARLEALAEPGGTCISETVLAQVRRKLELDFHDLGDQAVKNIPDPVHAYLLRERAVEEPCAPARKHTKRIWIGGIAALCLVPIAAWLLWPQGESRTPSEFMLPTRVDLHALTTVTSSDPRPSVAVMPFNNISNDAQQEIFSEGLAEDILNGLVKFSDIRVVGRASSFSLKGGEADAVEVGRVLGVQHLVRGSVRKSGDRIRVTAQVVSTADGAHLWSERYDRQLTDVFQVQDEITSAILAEIGQRFVPVEARGSTPTRSAEAYDAFLAGRYLFNRLEFSKAAAAFESAIAIDPEYADAYVGLANAYTFYVWWGIRPPGEMLPLVQQYLEKALTLEPGHIEARAAKTVLEFFIDRKHQASIDEITRLIRQYPNNVSLLGSYMVMLTAIGELDGAVELARQELALDPLSPFGHRQLAEQLYYAGQLDEAEAVANQAEKLGLGVATLLTMINFAQQDLDGVDAQLQRDDAAWGNGVGFREVFRLGYAFLNGNYVDSLVYWARIRFLPAHQTPRTQALLNQFVGNYDAAFDYLEELAASTDLFVVRNIRGTELQRAANPDYYAHPRYKEILELVSLDDASIARLRLPD